MTAFIVGEPPWAPSVSRWASRWSFDTSTPMVSWFIFSMPLLVIRGSPPGIRPGQRKRRGRSNYKSTRQTVSVAPIRPSPLPRGLPPSPAAPFCRSSAKSHKTSVTRWPSGFWAPARAKQVVKRHGRPRLDRGSTRPPTRTPLPQDKHLIETRSLRSRSSGEAAWKAATSAAMTAHGRGPKTTANACLMTFCAGAARKEPLERVAALSAAARDGSEQR